MVGCVHDVVRKKIFLDQFEDRQKKEISYSSLVFLSPKEEVKIDEPLYNPPKKQQDELLTIDGENEFGEPCMFGKCI